MNKNIFTALLKIFTTAAIIFSCYQFIVNCNDIKFIQDDAYTAFRYAKNFTEGKGLVFNEGEYVEGYTNFSWVMILSLIQYLKLDIETTAQSLSIIFGVCVLLITYFFIKKIFKLTNNVKSKEEIIFESVSIIPVYILANSPPLIYWSVSAMETTLFAFLTLLSIYLFLSEEQSKKKFYFFVFVSVINSLTRPEGVLFFLILISFSWLKNILTKSKNEHKKNFLGLEKKVITAFAYYAVPLFVFLLFRLIYYGYHLPNTFYAKTNFNIEFIIRGIKYFFEFAESNLIYGIIFMPIPFAYLNVNLRYRLNLLFFFILTYITFIILIGGDVLPVHRFFIPLLPLFFVLCALGMKEIIFLFNPPSRSATTDKKVGCNSLSLAAEQNSGLAPRFIPLIKTYSRALSLAVIILFTILYSYKTFDAQQNYIYEKRSYEAGLVKKMKIYASWLKEKNNSQNITVALSTIGAFSFYSNSTVIDLVGLTDEYIAHNPKEVEGINDELPVLWKEKIYNADYVLSRNPDYIIFPAGAKPSAFAECALFVQEEFYQNYYLQLIYSQELNQQLPIFTKRKTPQSYSPDSCSVSFVKYFIDANNLLLSMINRGDKKLLNEIIEKCDSAFTKCKIRKPDFDLIKGMAFFHSNMLVESNISLEESIKNDSLNMAARFYLFNLYAKTNNDKKMVEQIKWIKRYSPGALPNI